MKKIITSVLCTMLMLGSMISMTGCGSENIELSASTAGQILAATWIAAEKPSQETVSEISAILGVISEAIVATNGYAEALYPVVMDYLRDSDIDPAYVPLVVSGSLAVLNGIDALFVLNPDWKDDEAQVVQAVQAFLSGAQFVFGLQQDGPQMKSIIQQADYLDGQEKEMLEKVLKTSSVEHIHMNCICPIVSSVEHIHANCACPIAA